MNLPITNYYIPIYLSHIPVSFWLVHECGFEFHTFSFDRVQPKNGEEKEEEK